MAEDSSFFRSEEERAEYIRILNREYSVKSLKAELEGKYHLLKHTTKRVQMLAQEARQHDEKPCFVLDNPPLNQGASDV